MLALVANYADSLFFFSKSPDKNHLLCLLAHQRDNYRKQRSNKFSKKRKSLRDRLEESYGI